MARLKKFILDGVFVMQILIIFILIFENGVALPPVLQAFGRLHPLLLHLPIGLLLITVILLFARAHFHGQAFDDLLDLLLHFTALTASLTTLMGLFLSLEGNFGADQLRLHKWLGVALSFLCWGLLGVRDNMRLMKPVAAAGAVLLVFTGHYGANLTHGEDFVWGPLQEEELAHTPLVITDSTTLFAATIEPVFQSKCYGCHNPKKAKGNLVLSSIDGIIKGGETGSLWTPGDAESSLLIERLRLPLDHDDHMPPKDKVQLAADEIQFISLWIEQGADMKRKLVEVPDEDTLSQLASGIIPRYQQAIPQAPIYAFRFASSDKIKSLSTPNRAVFQIARNEPAIQADFYLREMYNRRDVEELLELKEQLISLNLSKMPVQDADLDIVARFPNLEILNLNNTNITSSGIQSLLQLGNLRSLSLAGTNVDAEGLRRLGTMPALEEVFVWNTALTAADASALGKQWPDIHWNIGFIPDENEILKLNPPVNKGKAQILGRGEKILLKHSLPGTRVRYTTDGTEPDSVTSPEFSGGVEFKNYVMIKTKAFKDGWLSSDVATYFFFRKGLTPDSAKLVSSPDDRFQGEGVKTLFDERQGLPDFYRHPAWIAFREDNMILDFSFSQGPPAVNNITLSFAHNGGHVCLPPEKMELWGGDDPSRLRLIMEKKFSVIPQPAKARTEGVSMDVPASEFRYYRLIATPTRKLPDGNRGNRKLWLMVDEVFIN